MTKYRVTHQHLEARLAGLRRVMPGPMSGFARLHKKAAENSRLSTSVNKMIELDIGIVVGCDGCIAYHVHDAV